MIWLFNTNQSLYINYCSLILLLQHVNFKTSIIEILRIFILLLTSYKSSTCLNPFIMYCCILLFLFSYHIMSLLDGWAISFFSVITLSFSLFHAYLCISMWCVVHGTLWNPYNSYMPTHSQFLWLWNVLKWNKKPLLWVVRIFHLQCMHIIVLNFNICTYWI